MRDRYACHLAAIWLFGTALIDFVGIARKTSVTWDYILDSVVNPATEWGFLIAEKYSAPQIPSILTLLFVGWVQPIILDLWPLLPYAIIFDG